MAAVVATCAIAATPASAVVVNAGGGRRLGIAPRPGSATSLPAPALAPRGLGNVLPATLAPGSLEYHGGLVLHTTRPYLVFWDPSGHIDAPTRSLFSRYLTDVAADSARSAEVFTASGPGDDVFGVTRQYSDATGYAASGETYVAADQAIADTQPYPAASGDCTSVNATATPTCVTDAQVEAELQRLIAAESLPTGTGAGAPVYFVITPASVNLCITAGACADNDFCAYHGGFVQNGTQVLYAAIPLADAAKDCQADGDPSRLQQPNGIAADVAVDNLSHEYNESISDPDLDAWYDGTTGNEEADLCQEYGATRDPVAGADPHAYAPALGGVASAGDLFDQQINGDPYYTQSEWSNGAGDCVLRAGQTLIPGFTISPRPQAGAPVQIYPMQASGPLSSATWSFGDGTGVFSAASTPAAQSHTYATPGTYTVSLTEVDSLGEVGTSRQTLTIPRSPVALFTESTGVAGAVVTRVRFDGSASSDPEPGGRITAYHWDFGDGFTASGPTTSHMYLVPGTYTVTLTVVGVDGLSAVATRQVRVERGPGAHLVWENAWSVAGVPEHFAASPNPPGYAAPVTYHWDFGDGLKATGPHATHTFRRPGEYWVSVTVTAADGLSNTDTRLLHIKPVEAITRLGAKPSDAHAVLVTIGVNGPGTLVIAGRRYTLAKAGTVSRVVPLTTRQRRRLHARHVVDVRIPVRFRPLVGRAIATTTSVTLTS